MEVDLDSLARHPEEYTGKKVKVTAYVNPGTFGTALMPIPGLGDLRLSCIDPACSPPQCVRITCSDEQKDWLGLYEVSVHEDGVGHRAFRQCHGKMTTVYGTFISGADRYQSNKFFAYPYDIDSVVHVECCYVETDSRTKMSL